MTQDVIDYLVGTPLKLRERRPITKEQTQASYKALFEPAQPGNFPLSERFAVALFVAALHHDQAAHDFYSDKLRKLEISWISLLEQAAADALTNGPYGNYPEGPLSRENQPGDDWLAGNALNGAIGRKLATALEHAHFLIFHPRDALKNRLETLQAAGWDVQAIVTLSQLVSFLSYQLRVAHGLRILAIKAS